MLATRITGSSDLYLRDGRKPFHSINFVTAHDGFTLRDLVSYSQKHNDENGEGNQDGAAENWSCNYGFEGDAANPDILAIRERQVRNFLATLLLSTGTPMLSGGDEFGRTQRGSNNAYCQNNEITWYDWASIEKNSDLVAFTKALIAFRLRHPAFRRPEFFTGKNAPYNPSPDIVWYDKDGEPPDWAHIDGVIGCRIDGSRAEVLADRDEYDFFLIFNASEEQVRFELPLPSPGTKWFRALDTSLPAKFALLGSGDEELVLPQGHYQCASRSMACLVTRSLR
jgi:glycogen operon protein